MYFLRGNPHYNFQRLTDSLDSQQQHSKAVTVDELNGTTDYPAPVVTERSIGK